MKRRIAVILLSIMLIGLVCPVYAMTAQVKDQYYRLKDENGYIYYHIPVIVADEGYDMSLSKKIQGFYTEIYEECKLLANDKDSLTEVDCGGIGYVCGQNDEIFSLIVKRGTYRYNVYCFDTYNMDIQTGEELTHEDVLNSYGYSYKNFITEVKEMLPDLFKEVNKYQYKYMPQKDIDNALKYTLDDETLSEIQIYINPNGELCYVTWFATFSGTGTCSYPINFEKKKLEDENMFIYEQKTKDTYEIRFPEEEILPSPDSRLTGDVNSDGAVDAKDATQILRHVNGKSSVISTQTGSALTETIRVSDVNGDESVDAKDATQILRHVNGKTSVFDSMK